MSKPNRARRRKPSKSVRERRAGAEARARYERFVDYTPAGMVLACGKVVGVDFPQAVVRKHIEQDCKRCAELRVK